MVALRLPATPFRELIQKPKEDDPSKANQGHLPITVTNLLLHRPELIARETSLAEHRN